ncbi:sigma-70 family RNA polymerase sigma factor [bacterium AH-315-J04]|nr:sigma-70 family RNA polymerase sigma factor [bacterium AH-315-J04]
MIGGDAAALHKLIRRYDRLVRYNVFRVSKSRCQADPHWLDAIASEVWSGFVERCQAKPDEAIDSMSALLSKIARNRSISALRRATGNESTQSLDSETNALDQTLSADEDLQPDEVAERLELLEILRDSLSDLDGVDRSICDELGLIMERRWKEAGERLEMSESTLRSRWKGILDKLKREISRKTGENFAP